MRAHKGKEPGVRDCASFSHRMFGSASMHGAVKTHLVTLCIAVCWTVAHSFAPGPLFGNNPLNLRHEKKGNQFSPLLSARGTSRVGQMLSRRAHQVQMLSSATQEEPKLDAVADTPPARTAVIGSGPAGLATAIMLARSGWPNIVLYDRLKRLPKSDDSRFWEENERAYNIGLDLRGQNALRGLDCWDRVESCTADVTGRIDWVPGADEPRETNTSKTRGYTTKIIQRDRLAGCLLEEIETKYSEQIRVEFEAECKSVRWIGGGDEGVQLTVAQQTESGVKEIDVEADFVVGADGVNSKVRSAMAEDPGRERGFRVKRFEDRNVRLYKTITMRPAPGQKVNLNYSARTASDINLDALPTREGSLIGVVLFRPDDQRVLGARSGAAVRALFAEHFPMFEGMLSDAACEAFAQKPPSSLPIFQYCGPVLHKGGSTVVLGDAIHAVKPFFGLGVNSAFEDIAELRRCLHAAPDRPGALSEFSRRRGKEAKAIVEVSQAFDRPGFWGFASFVLPIIMDSIFGRFFPKLFKPNFLAYTKDPSVTFAGARARKRLDRLLQCALLGALLLAVPALLSLAFRLLQAALLPVPA